MTTPSPPPKLPPLKLSPQTVEMLAALTPEQLEQAIRVTANLLYIRARKRAQAKADARVAWLPLLSISGHGISGHDLVPFENQTIDHASQAVIEPSGQPRLDDRQRGG